MIVVGSSHRSRLGRAAAGATASVIGYGFDGSPESRVALRAIARQRRGGPEGVAVAPVVVVTVCSS